MKIPANIVAAVNDGATWLAAITITQPLGLPAAKFVFVDLVDVNGNTARVTIDHDVDPDDVRQAFARALCSQRRLPRGARRQRARRRTDDR